MSILPFLSIRTGFLFDQGADIPKRPGKFEWLFENQSALKLRRLKYTVYHKLSEPFFTRCFAVLEG